jgi:hypothetical protein
VCRRRSSSPAANLRGGHPHAHMYLGSEPFPTSRVTGDTGLPWRCPRYGETPRGTAISEDSSSEPGASCACLRRGHDSVHSRPELRHRRSGRASAQHQDAVAGAVLGTAGVEGSSAPAQRVRPTGRRARCRSDRRLPLPAKALQVLTGLAPSLEHTRCKQRRRRQAWRG